ncbi:FG-GAP-like repeat-containing protein [Stagnimonas aquatica]|nr:FG-GAP-like repeat-containing protein [Stagnimonas aquatica]
MGTSQDFQVVVAPARTLPALVLALSVVLAACGGGGGGEAGGGTTPPPTPQHLVSTSPGPGTSFSPGSANVNSGGSATFTVTLATGYSNLTVSGCGGTAASRATPGTVSYSTGGVTANCTVTAAATADPVVLAPPAQAFVAHVGGAPLRAPLVAALNPATSYTMEGWIHLGRALPQAWIMGRGRPIDRGASGVEIAAALKLGGDGRRLQFAFSTTTSFALDAPEPIPLGRWTHVAAVLDGGQARLLVNGAVVATGSYTGTLRALTDVPFGVGAPYDAAGLPANSHEPGLHARQLRVWSVARSATQIQAAAGQSLPTDRTGLVARWPLDERRGVAATDAEGRAGLTRILRVGTSRTAVLDSGPYFELSTVDVPAGVLTDGSSGAVIDIDGDGDLDLVAFQVAFPPTFPATERRLLGFRNDAGRFVEATESLLGDIVAINPRDAWVADFTGDGRKDLFIADTGTDTEPYPGTQSRLLVGTAAGRLSDQTATRLPRIDHYSHGVSAGDIDGDSALDLYLANYDGSGSVLWRNQGGGSFLDESSRVTEERVWPSPPSDVAFCDFNGDSRPDLVIGGSYNPSVGAGTEAPTRLLMNDGTGRFAADARFPIPAKLHGDKGNTVAIVCLDVNGDGKLDLLQATDAESKVPGLQLLLNEGSGQLSDVSSRLDVVFPETDGWVSSIDIADLDNDGRPDLVLRTIGNADSGKGRLSRSILLNRGGGKFVDASELLDADTSTGLVVGDFDRDGRIDLLAIDLRDRLRHYRSIKPINAALFDD